MQMPLEEMPRASRKDQGKAGRQGGREAGRQDGMAVTLGLLQRAKRCTITRSVSRPRVRGDTTNTSTAAPAPGWQGRRWIFRPPVLASWL